MIQHLQAQIDVEATLQDVTNDRETSISESYQTKLTLLIQENESLKKEVGGLTNELEKKLILASSKGHHQMVEIQELQKELTINLK